MTPQCEWAKCEGDDSTKETSFVAFNTHTFFCVYSVLMWPAADVDKGPVLSLKIFNTNKTTPPVSTLHPGKKKTTNVVHALPCFGFRITHLRDNTATSDDCAVYSEILKSCMLNYF